jgi:hypothetical protein
MPRIVLSAQGLDRAASVSKEAFEFIGNSCKIQCTQFQAAFISPRVHQLPQEDKTLDSFFIGLQTREITENRLFAFLEQLIGGLPIEPVGGEVVGLLELATLLGSSEWIAQLHHDETEINESNVCFRLRTKSAAGLSVEDEIEFAASNFYLIGFEKLKGIDLCILEAIVTSKSLRLENEDSLLNLIHSLDSEDRLFLLRYLHPEYLTREAMAEVVELLCDCISDPLIWASLCPRLCLRVSNRQSEHQCNADSLSRTGMTFGMDGSSRGIISHLTGKWGGNVHEKGIVTLSSKSTADYTNPLNTVVNLETDAAWSSRGEPGQWICWDFHEMRIRPTCSAMNTCRMKSWVLEGSVDGESWTEVDRQTDSIAFPGWLTNSFDVSTQEDFRFIRLTQTGKRSDGHDILLLSRVEFFGTLFT